MWQILQGIQTSGTPTLQLCSSKYLCVALIILITLITLITLMTLVIIDGVGLP